MKKEKNETRIMVEDLKQQMIIGLQSAVDKTRGLQKQLDTVTAQLDTVTAQKEELEQQLAAILRGEA